tara:strand:- start:3933 stop:4208 length:276 start_codon:yes stop_codon:yes gene_type:complete
MRLNIEWMAPWIYGKPLRNYLYHTTEREFDFIDKLGTYNEHSAKVSKVDILRGYLKGMEKRVNWGSISKKKAVKYATARLAREVELSLTII